MTKDEMVGWHLRLNGHEFEQALGVGDRQGSLACCSPWGHKELDVTEQRNWTDVRESVTEWLNLSWVDFKEKWKFSTQKMRENSIPGKG